jgi:uncharacterized protein YqeY
MSLKAKIDEEIKDAMRSKDSVRLNSLRAIKAKILLEETSKGRTVGLSEEAELKLLASLVKQRRDAVAEYQKAGRTDLLDNELAEIAIIEKFLPAQLSTEEITAIIKNVIAQTGVTSVKEMGKVMGVASKELAGRADNKIVAEIVKSLLA